MAGVNSIGERSLRLPIEGDATTQPASEHTAPPQHVPLGPARETSVASKLHAGLAPPSQGVPLRIRADRGGGTRTVYLPSNNFNLVEGRPTRLVGPDVNVIADAPLYSDPTIMTMGRNGSRSVSQPSSVIPVRADAQGTFDAPDIDVAQTTAFYAAQRIHDWAARTSGRPITWANGPLPVTIHAWVTSTPTTLNAYYDLTGSHGISLGTYGDVRDGRPQPYSGAGLPTLDMARTAAGMSTEPTKPVSDAERARRLEVLARLDQLVQRGARDDAAAVIRRELQREPPREATAAIPDGPQAAALQQFAGRHLYFSFLELSSGLLASHGAATNAFFATASDRSIAAHEAGHAVLEAERPSLSTPAGLAFHEAFGDLASIASTIDDDDAARDMLEENQGDLRRSTSATRICQELEQAVNQTRASRVYMTRDATQAINITSLAVLTSRDSATMPEAHELSRVISSSMFELFANRGNRAMEGNTGDARIAAMRQVNDRVSAILHDSTLLLPEDGGTLADVFGSLVSAARRFDAQSNDAPFEPELRAILLARGVPEDALREPASMRRLPDVSISASATTADALADERITQLMRDWSIPAGATRLPDEDVRTSRGMRLIRVRYERRDDVTPPTPEVWTAAMTFDRSGRLIAASHSE